MYGKPFLAASLAIALESSAWTGAGTVSRFRDLPDKSLQDYMVVSYVFYELTRTSCMRKKYLLFQLLEKVLEATNKSLATGEIFLLYTNAYVACIDEGIGDMDANALEATKLVIKTGLEDYLEFLSLHKPSYYGRFYHSFFAKNRGFTSYSQTTGLAKNIPFDPVINEAMSTFAYTRLRAKEMITKLGCGLPSSTDIDEIYRKICTRYIDYLVYRKYGLDEAFVAKNRCEKGEEPNYSLGSIADLVAVTLYYYLNECFAHSSSYLRKLAVLF